MVQPPAPLRIAPNAIRKGIDRLDARITELEKFDFSALVNGRSPELTALEVAIKDTLNRCFGERPTAYMLYERAASLHYFSGVTRRNLVDYNTPTRRKFGDAIALLKQAKLALEEDLADSELHLAEAPLASSKPVIAELSRRVFVVHGHDEGARETVARFLLQLGFDPIILHEQANRGGTVMEKIETHGDVGFAVVLLTPDDVGSAKGGTPEPRARQNVLLELGYFLGRLGRNKVCALKRGSVEIPSDFAGVVWESMEGNGWKQALGRELEAAGHEIDWNKAMRA